MRHTDAGLAIPDFPLAFGHVVPPQWDAKIAVHFAHRVGALVVTTGILAAAGHVFWHHRLRRELVRPATLLLVLLTTQITLGALTVLSGKQHIINSLHVVNGAMVLATALTLTLRAHRARFPLTERPKRFERLDQPERSERLERSERPERSERSERSERFEAPI